MTEPTIALPDDERVIEPEDERYNARLIRREDQTHDLARIWVKFDGEPTPFEPGQYMTIGVFADGKLWQRPYSVASAPREAGDSGYELYVRLVPIIRFTTLLWRLPIGHGMRMIGPKGKFMLEPDDDRTHLFVSTGTGIAPFISMIRETMADGAPRKTVVLHGASYVGGARLPRRARGPGARRRLPGHVRPDGQPPGRSAERRLDGSHRSRGARRQVRLPRPPPAAREDGRLHLRQSRDDHQRRNGAHGPRLPRVPRQEGALLAQGQGRGPGLSGPASGAAAGGHGPADSSSTCWRLAKNPTPRSRGRSTGH